MSGSMVNTSAVGSVTVNRDSRWTLSSCGSLSPDIRHIDVAVLLKSGSTSIPFTPRAHAVCVGSVITG